MSSTNAKPLSGFNISLHFPEPLYSHVCMCIWWILMCMYAYFSPFCTFEFDIFCTCFVFFQQFFKYRYPFVTVTIDFGIWIELVKKKGEKWTLYKMKGKIHEALPPLMTRCWQLKQHTCKTQCWERCVHCCEDWVIMMDGGLRVCTPKSF